LGCGESGRTETNAREFVLSGHEWTEQELIEAYEIRCAHMEFDGGLTRKQAERAAYYDWRKQFPGVVVPDAIRDSVRLSEAKPSGSGSK
jgi:hypothetical protein